MQYEPRSILVVDVSPFGTGLLMLPAMRALRDALPNTHITAAAARGVCEILADCHLVDETIDLGVVHHSDQNLGGAVKRLFQLTRKGRRDGFDWVLDFSPRVETQVASFLSWRARHITPSRVSHLLDVFLKRRESFADDHAAACASVLKQVGVKKIEPKFVIPVPSEESLRFEKQIIGKRATAAAPASPIVVLHSARAEEPGEWSLSQYADFAWRMTNNFEARVAAVDEPADSRFTRGLKPLLPAKSVLLTSPRAVELAAAVERASLVVTDERGVAKVATDAGAPVVEISDSPSPLSPSLAYRAVRASSRARVEVGAVYEAACEMIQGSRTASLIGR